MLNRHEIMGRLVRDPELTPRRNSDGSDRINFTVAVDDDFGDGTEFFDCVMFGSRAAVIEKYFHKGDGIYVEGKGSIHSYEGKDGVKRKSYSIMVRDFKFPPGSKKDGKSSVADSWEQFDEDDPFQP